MQPFALQPFMCVCMCGFFSYLIKPRFTNKKQEFCSYLVNIEENSCITANTEPYFEWSTLPFWAQNKCSLSPTPQSGWLVSNCSLIDWMGPTLDSKLNNYSSIDQ